MNKIPSSEKSEMNVKVIAIENDRLILESMDDGQRIYWPMSKIMGKIVIGSKITLNLKTTEDTENNITQITDKMESGETKYNDMHKILEQLIN